MPKPKKKRSSTAEPPVIATPLKLATSVDSTEEKHTNQPVAMADLLRMDIYKFTPSERKQLVERLRKLAIQVLSGLSIELVQDAARFIDCVANFRSLSTPAEDLLMNMVSCHYERGGLTPTWLEHQVDPEYQDGFRVNYDDAIGATRRIQQHYSGILEENQNVGS